MFSFSLSLLFLICNQICFSTSLLEVLIARRLFDLFLDLQVKEEVILAHSSDVTFMNAIMSLFFEDRQGWPCFKNGDKMSNFLHITFSGFHQLDNEGL